MNITHKTINSIVLLALGIAFYIQNGLYSKMKILLESIDVDKLKKSNDFIRESHNAELNLKAQKMFKELEKKNSELLSEKTAEIYKQYNELLAHLFIFLKDMNYADREPYLKLYPENEQSLRDLLSAYDRDKLPSQNQKEN